MPTLSIRNVEKDVMEKLKTRAKLNERSVEAEVRFILKNATGPFTSDEALAVADRIAAMTPKGAKLTDSTKIIREFRDK